jgi:ABC-type transporter Mla MlaB component
VLTLEGQLVGEYTTFIEESCNAALSKDRRVSLQLNDVSTIDEAGRSLLRKLAHKGIEIRASGIYTSYVVRSINAANENTANSQPGNGHNRPRSTGNH